MGGHFRQELIVFTRNGIRGNIQAENTNHQLSFFILSGSPSSTAISRTCYEQDAQEHSDFIRLLSIALALDVHVLPLTWQPALEGLGEGATSEISQSPFNAEVSFAFKRFNILNPSTGLSEAKFRSLQYNALVAEVAVLSCPAIDEHPNIACLQGVCWEVVSSEEIRPVLVFRKAEGGDLRQFLSSSFGSGLSLCDRQVLCGEIAKGLDIMHQCGVCRFRWYSNQK